MSTARQVVEPRQDERWGRIPLYRLVPREELSENGWTSLQKSSDPTMVLKDRVIQAKLLDVVGRRGRGTGGQAAREQMGCEVERRPTSAQP